MSDFKLLNILNDYGLIGGIEGSEDFRSLFPINYLNEKLGGRFGPTWQRQLLIRPMNPEREIEGCHGDTGICDQTIPYILQSHNDPAGRAAA